MTHINDICTQRFGQVPESTTSHGVSEGVLQYSVLVGGRGFEIFFMDPNQLDSCVFYYQTLKRIGITTMDIVHFGRISQELGFYVLNQITGTTILTQKVSPDIANQGVAMLLSHQKAVFTGFGTVTGTMQFYTAKYETLYEFLDGQIKAMYDHLINYRKNVFDEVITKLLDFRHIFSETDKSSVTHGQLFPDHIIIQDHTVTFIRPGIVRLCHPAWDVATLGVYQILYERSGVISTIIEEARHKLNVTDSQFHFFVVMQLLKRYIHADTGIPAQTLQSIIEKAGSQI